MKPAPRPGNRHRSEWGLSADPRLPAPRPGSRVGRTAQAKEEAVLRIDDSHSDMRAAQPVKSNASAPPSITGSCPDLPFLSPRA